MFSFFFSVDPGLRFRYLLKFTEKVMLDLFLSQDSF